MKFRFCSTQFLSILALLLALVPFSSAQDSESRPTLNDFWKSVFEEGQVVEISIQISRENWEKMQPSNPRGGFEYVKADLVIDGKKFAESGLRFKGNSSYRFSSNSLKRPLKVDTNRFVKGQKLHGKTKFNLSNAFLDSAFLKEKLAYDLYSKAGLVTPGVGWANVKLTIEGMEKEANLGIYVLIEQVDDKLLQRKLGSQSKGSLLMKPEISSWRYLGEDPKLYEQFNIKSGEENVDQIKQFGELLKLIEQGSDEQFKEQIGKKLDLKMFAGYLAATSLLVNLDSFVAAPHNYYLVLDKADGKLKILPWDVNEAFGTFTLRNDPANLTEWDIQRPWVSNHRLITRLFQLDEFVELYQGTIRDLAKNEFTREKLFASIKKYEDAIAPYIQKQGLQALFGLQMGIDGDKDGINASVSRRTFGIKPFIEKRIESVQSQLKGSKGQTIRGGFF